MKIGLGATGVVADGTSVCWKPAVNRCLYLHIVALLLCHNVCWILLQHGGVSVESCSNNVACLLNLAPTSWWRVCWILLQHGGSDALCTLHKIVTWVWEQEVVPEEWYQGFIISLYKGKESKSECSNYTGIILLSVPGKVFAHIILARIKPTLLSHRRP